MGIVRKNYFFAICLLLLSGAVGASEVSFRTEQQVRALRDAYLYDAQNAQERLLSGHQVFQFGGPQGLFCQSATQIDLYWKATVKDAHIVLDDKGDTIFRVQFGVTQLATQGYVRDLLSCGWNGGELTTQIQEINVDFKTSPQEGSPYPRVSLEKLTFRGLSFPHMAVGARDGWKVAGSSPDWLNNWLEQNLQMLLYHFMASPLKKHLDDFLTRYIEDQLKGRDGEGQDPLGIPSLH